MSVALAADAGSFDYVRLTPHFAQDDMSLKNGYLRIKEWAPSGSALDGRFGQIADFCMVLGPLPE